MRTLYIVSLVVTVALFIVTGYYAESYSQLDWQIFFDDLYSDDSYTTDYYSDSRYDALHDITFMGGIASLLFTAFYILTFSFTLKSIQRTTAKVMSIIGLSISGIVFLSCLVPIAEPANVAFNDEFAPLMILYALIMLAFCIVNLIQAIRHAAKGIPDSQLLDDF